MTIVGGSVSHHAAYREKKARNTRQMRIFIRCDDDEATQREHLICCFLCYTVRILVPHFFATLFAADC